MSKRQKARVIPDREDGWSQLHIASLHGDTSRCTFILDRAATNGCDKLLLEKTPKSGSTALHFAVLSGSIACLECIVRYLVRCPPQIAVSILTYKSTPTPLPTSSLHPISVRKLAESFGPSEVVPSVRRSGFSALDLAVICDSAHATTILLDAMHWASSNAVSTAIPSPHLLKNHIASDILQVAIAKQNADIVNALLDRGASLEAETDDDRGMRPVHWAAAFGHADILGLLLRRGADPLSLTTVSKETIQDIAMQSPDDVNVRGMLDIHLNRQEV